MFGSLTCRNGHTWAPGPGPAWSGEDRCPRCGAPTRSPDVVGRRAWTILGLAAAGVAAAGVCGVLFWRLLGPLLPLVVVLAFGLVYVAVWFAAQADRAGRMEAVCAEMGLAFTGQLSPARLRALGPFRALRPEQSALACHLMEGTSEGWGVALLELRGPGAGDDHPPPSRTAVLVSGPAAPAGLPGREVARHFRARRPAATDIQQAGRGDRAPPRAAPAVSVGELEFRLAPASAGDWLWRWLGWLDTPCRDHPAFAAAYRVVGPCGAAVRRALRPEVLDVFAAYPGWHVEALGGRLLAHRPGPCEPDDCPRLIAEVVRMHRALLKAWAASRKG